MQHDHPQHPASHLQQEANRLAQVLGREGILIRRAAFEQAIQTYDVPADALDHLLQEEAFLTLSRLESVLQEILLLPDTAVWREDGSEQVQEQFLQAWRHVELDTTSQKRSREEDGLITAG
jgi:hypothetical protein